MTTLRARRSPMGLLPDPARVVARLFLPGEEPPHTHSRVREVFARVMAMEEAEVDELVARLLEVYAPRHPGYEDLLIRHASVVTSRVDAAYPLSAARTLLLGAIFTAEYAVEGAAVCNPSAVRHPDQTSLDDGQIRIAISVRGIGEGHISSIGFHSLVAGPGEQMSFTSSPRHPVSAGVMSPSPWQKSHLNSVLADLGDVDVLTQAVLDCLPSQFSEPDLEHALSNIHPGLLARHGAAETKQRIRRIVSSAYAVTFDAAVPLEQRVIMPAAAEESNGMEDARFTRFVDADGTVDYRATYTAYDGTHIAPRLLTSTDLRCFRSHRLAGSAARNKGMALFPRLVNGRHLALCRSDGENTTLATSDDGLVWNEGQHIHEPISPWEALQVGNCGPPIETDHGWVVLTHGVGAMRTYAIGVVLLDLDDPSTVLGRLPHPLLEPEAGERDGYVPNVVYSCGGLLHDGVLWLPYGIGDSRVGVAHVRLDDLLSALNCR